MRYMFARPFWLRQLLIKHSGSRGILTHNLPFWWRALYLYTTNPRLLKLYFLQCMRYMFARPFWLRQLLIKHSGSRGILTHNLPFWWRALYLYTTNPRLLKLYFLQCMRYMFARPFWLRQLLIKHSGSRGILTHNLPFWWRALYLYTTNPRLLILYFVPCMRYMFAQPYLVEAITYKTQWVEWDSNT